MDNNSTSEEIMLDLLDQHEHYPGNINGITVDEHTRNQREQDSTYNGMKGLIEDRDPKEVNKCLEVNFEDVIAEPASVHSLDKVWLWSHALFEVSRLWFYRLISLLLAVPVAMLLGVLFAFLSCVHIWLIMPIVQLLLIHMHWVKVIWASVLGLTISPFFISLGRCCEAIHIRWAKD